MKSLLLLVDSAKYVQEHCYQHQLYYTLLKNYRVRMMSARAIKYYPFVRTTAYDRILCALRLRTADRLIQPLERLLGDTPFFFYDEDVWHAFIDGYSCKGAYHRIAKRLNVTAFLVTSQWWRNYAAKQGLPARFVRIGMLPQYCDCGPEWDTRPIRLGFQGTLHPHRRIFYDKMKECGLSVDLFRSVSYGDYLSNLHRMRISVHTEDAPWTVEGNAVSRNALWGKEAEVAARGAFTIRDYEDEADAYGIAELPTVMPFRRVEDVPEIVSAIEAMPSSERRDRIAAAVETVRRRDDWASVVQAMET